MVGSSGHEAVQVASVFALDRDKDWVLPYYRDMGVGLAWGFTPEDIFLGVVRQEDRSDVGWPPASRALVELASSESSASPR